MVVSTGAVGVVTPGCSKGVVVGGDTVAVVGAVGTVTALSSRGEVGRVESATAAGPRAPRLRNNGGATMTIAVSSNARKKRLSID